MPIFQNTLKNGTVLITEPIATVKTVAIGFWFSVGSRYEHEKQRGISHFVEHMVFKGTQKRTAFDIAVSFDRIGGYLNAFTERENLCIHCVVPSNYTAEALEILCDMTENALFRPEDVEKERSVIESEIISSLDDPEEAALDTVISKIWPHNSISQSISGTVEDVHKITRDELYQWYKNHISSGELTVFLAGNFDNTQVENRLQSLSPRQIQTKPGVFLGLDTTNITSYFSCPVWQSEISFVPADFQQEQLFYLFPLPIPYTEDEYYGYAILNALIGDTMSSRLFQALRENGGYCYNVYSFFTFNSDCGYWCGYSSSAKENLLSVAKTLQDEITLLLEKGFSKNEVDAAKEHLCGEEIINSEDMEQRLKRLSRNYYFNFPQCSVEESIEKIRGISADMLITCMKKLFDFDQQSLIVYGPKLSRKNKKQIIQEYSK